jgi:tetratricopeptide (TPR) repeat protein
MVGDDRWDILNGILDEMDIKKGEGPKQHWMIIGPRGIGKSHLLTLLYHKVRKDRKLNKKWIPLLFPEDLRRVGNLYKFLERALNEIILELEKKESTVSGELKQKVKQINQVPMRERADNFFSLVSWVYEQTGKHIVLITENLQRLLGKKLPVIEQKKLRAFLQTSDALLIIGSATTVFDALHDHSHPFYHFFHIRRLEDLSFLDMKTLIIDILAQRQHVELKKETIEGNGRLKALYSFTGGNPRMAVFLADILSTELPEEIIELMDGVLDELTPYFESIINATPDCFEEVINTLAAFEPAQSPGEIAGHLEIPQTTVRSYLKKLKEDGYVKVAFSKGKSNYYCLNEYLYRVWYQMRDSSHREETRWLMELLLMIYSREIIIEEKKRLDALADEGQPVIIYKKLIDQTAKFIDYNPDYCKVIEWCVDSMAPDRKKVTKKDQKKQKFLVEAFDYFENKQYDKAIKICENILNINPKKEFVYLLWGECLRKQGRYNEAIKKFKETTELNPDSDQGYLRWGYCLRDQGCYEKAIEKFKDVINVNPESFEAYGARGDCLRDLELYNESEKQYRKALEINKYYEDAYIAWGHSYYKQSLYKKAIEKCKELIELNPKAERGYLYWGDVLVKQNLYEEAINKYKIVINLNPKSEGAFGSWGNCLKKQERYDEAIEKYKKVIEINPKSKAVYFLWGDCFRLQNRYEEAIEKVKKGMELSVDYINGYFLWGDCLRLQGRYEEAIEIFKKLLELKPEFGPGYYLWGECLLWQRKYEEAVAFYEKYNSKIKIPYTIYSYGRCLMEVKRYDDAIKQFEKMIDSQPDFYDTYLPYGQLLERKEEKEDALIAYLTYIRLVYVTLAGDFDFQEIFNKHIVPLLNKLDSQEYVKQFYASEKKTFSDSQLGILLILLEKYDVVNDHIKDIIKVYLGKNGEEKKEFDLFIFTIKLSVWLKLIEGNLHEVLKLVEMYVEYINALENDKEKESTVLNFFLDLFRNQINFNIDVENVKKVLKRMEDEEGVPFSDVISKVWTCLSEPDSIEAQRYLAEKAIVEVVKEIKKLKEKPQKEKKVKEIKDEAAF